MEDNNVKKILLILLASVCFLSCTEHRLYRKINGRFDGKDMITVRMADIVRQPWDTMYVFQPMSHYPGLEHYQNYPDYHDTGRRIVFVKDGAVVFREDEVAVEWAYSLEFDDDLYYFTPETAVFRAVKITEDTSRKHIVLYLSDNIN